MRLLGVIVTILATWLGMLGPALAAEPLASSHEVIHAYTYDVDHYSSEGLHSTTKRGPPAHTHGRTVANDAVDRWSRGPAARPETGNVFAASHIAVETGVRIVGSTTTTLERVRRSDREPSSFERAGVAAKTDIGLSGRGLVPAAGTRIRPEGLPEGWRITGTKSQGGVLYRDPTNAGNSVRVMQGNPHSPFPNSQVPYVRWQRNGHPLDQYGNLLPSAKVPEAHIPLSDFRFLPEVFGP